MSEVNTLAEIVVQGELPPGTKPALRNVNPLYVLRHKRQIDPAQAKMRVLYF